MLEAGVQFAVVKQSFQAALANVALTALALWLPLLPLLFILRRLMQVRAQQVVPTRFSMLLRQDCTDCMTAAWCNQQLKLSAL